MGAAADWRGLLTRQVPQARQILKKVLVGSVRCEPRGEGQGRYYAFSAEATVAKVLASVSHPIMVASPRGEIGAFVGAAVVARGRTRGVIVYS
jgi:hypothetical protein